MTAAATRTFPGPRTYQAWLRELAQLHPRRLWFSHLLVHRVEALVQVARSSRLESFALALLRRLFATAPASLASIDRLQINRPLAISQLRELATAGLLHMDSDVWTLTGAGRQAVETGHYTQHPRERRVFYFLDNAGAGAPQYVPLRQTAGPSADIGENWSFDPAHLRTCLTQPASWKQQVGFAEDVEALILEPAEDWRQVILDRAEHAPLLFVESPEGEAESVLFAYLVRCENWTLQREPPALTMRTGWRDTFTDFAEGLSLEAWHEAWLTWARARQLPPRDASSCQVEYAACKVRVKAPKALVEPLRAARHEVLRGETWLTLGSGRTRAAALLEIQEQE